MIRTIKEGWAPPVEMSEKILSCCLQQEERRDNFEKILAEIWFNGHRSDKAPRQLLNAREGRKEGALTDPKEREEQEKIKQKIKHAYTTLLTVLRRGCYIPPDIVEQLTASLSDSDPVISEAAFEA